MATLFTKVKLYLEDNGKTFEEEDKNILLRNDGSGDYIHTWNVSGLAKPSDSQLASYDSAGDTDEINVGVRNTRKKSYGDIGDQLDLLYKDIVAGKLDTTGEWFKKIKAVKDANPKS
tara:strand:+ start:63 stop:413 length:351 start_codon:yes stop_codon:yes gene_type:complete